MRFTTRFAGRPWMTFLVLFALLSSLGPYDVNNRRDHEGLNADLKNAISGQAAGIEEGHNERRVAVIALGLFALALAWRTRRVRRLGLALPPTPAWDPYPALTGQPDRSVAVPIVAFIVVAMASALWADDPPLVARRIVVFLCFCFAAWTVARAWRLSDILLFVILGCTVTLAASVVLEVMHGTFHPADGGWRLSGLTHPNRHAQEGAIVIIASLAAMRLDPAHRRAYLVAVWFAAAMIILTRSRTSAMTVVFALTCAAFYTMPRRRALGTGIAMAAVAVAIFVIGPAIADSAQHALLFGRSAGSADVGTLTGRTQLWRVLLTYAGARPLAGYGWEGFWTPEHTADVSLKLGWVIAHGHNGYLDILLTVGAIGLTLFVLTFAAGIAHAVRCLNRNRGDLEALFAFTMLIWIATEMLSETVLAATHYAAFLVMVLLARQVATAPARARARARAYTPAATPSLTV